MKQRLLGFLSVIGCALTSPLVVAQPSFYQDTIVLQTPKGELAQLRSEGTVISIDRAKLLKLFERYGRQSACEAIFPANAVVDLSEASRQINQLFAPELRYPNSLAFIVAGCLENGDAHVRSDLTGKDIAVIVLLHYNYYPASGLRQSIFKELGMETSFFSVEIEVEIHKIPDF